MGRFMDGTKRTTDEYAVEAYRLFKSGLTFDQIGSILNLEPPVVAAMVESLPEFNATKDEAWRLLRAGWKYDQIGVKLRMSASTARDFAYSSNAMKKEYADEESATADAKRRAAIRAQKEMSYIKRICSDDYVFEGRGVVLFESVESVKIVDANRIREKHGVNPIRRPTTAADLARARKMLLDAGYLVIETDHVVPLPKLTPKPKPVFQCWNPDHRHMTESVADRCNSKHSEVRQTKFKIWKISEKIEALRLHRMDMTFKAIGEKFGVSAGSARGAVGWALMRERRQANR